MDAAEPRNFTNTCFCNNHHAERYAPSIGPGDQDFFGESVHDHFAQLGEPWL